MTRGSTARSPARRSARQRSDIAVFPAPAPWKEYTGLRKTDCIARYSLAVTIAVPNVAIDIYTPVALQVGIPIKIEVASGQLHLHWIVVEPRDATSSFLRIS